MKVKSDVTKAHRPDVFDALGGVHADIGIHLDKLVALTTHLGVVPPNVTVRDDAREVVAFFSGPAREHSYDEERHVFPVLLACGNAKVKLTAETLCEDHAWLEFLWLDVEPQLEVVAAGLTSYDLPVLRSEAKAFVTAVRDHMVIEELVFLQLRDELKPTRLRSMSRAMAALRAAGRF